MICNAHIYSVKYKHISRNQVLRLCVNYNNEPRYSTMKSLEVMNFSPS